mgnify:CR=1 FL=1
MRPFWDHMMAFSLIILIFLGFFDAVATLVWINHEYATEANPLMAALINHNQALFLAIKLTVTLGCTAILWKIRDRAIAKVGVILALIVYLYILYKHI